MFVVDVCIRRAAAAAAAASALAQARAPRAVCKRRSTPQLGINGDLSLESVKSVLPPSPSRTEVFKRLQESTPSAVIAATFRCSDPSAVSRVLYRYRCYCCVIVVDRSEGIIEQDFFSPIPESY